VLINSVLTSLVMFMMFFMCRKGFLKKQIFIDLDSIGKPMSKRKNIGWQNRVLFANQKTKDDWVFKI
jgi:hypothetical protein